MNEGQTNDRKIDILVIDDNLDNLRLLTDLLNRRGYKVRPMSDGRRAISSARKRPPDLILLDIMMPGLNGYDVCEQLKADGQTREIPVIFLSALNETMDKVRAFDFGGVDYIIKPFQSEEVLARVRTHLELAGMRKRLQAQNTRLTREIVEHEETRAALQRAKDVAESANQAKSVFLSNMSHELRSPLTAILGFARVMARSSDLPKDHCENVDIIRRSGEHLLTLINQVLELSKIEAGRITLETVAFDLHRLLADVQDMFVLRAETKGLWLRFERNGSTPRFVVADEIKLRQVLINLLNNAVKFTSEGGVTVRIGCEETGTSEMAEAQAINLHFEIEDTGHGIAPEETGKIFEAFGQTETGRRTAEGTGLGLPISRKFAQLMGGDIRVASKAGCGSRFTFHIWAQTAESVNPEPERLCHVFALEPGQPRYRVLVADDRRTNRQLLAKLLKPLGFDMREAENGQEAVDTWKAWAPHLIWMDIRMPVMDGNEAAKQIRMAESGSIEEKARNTKIIALTAGAFKEERLEALAAGCDDYLPKPFRETELFELMSRHIGVRFVYDERNCGADSGNPKPEALIPETLAALPEKWLNMLEQSAERADFLSLSKAISQIRGWDTALADTLARLADNFQYDGILKLIREKDGER